MKSKESVSRFNRIRRIAKFNKKSSFNFFVKKGENEMHITRKYIREHPEKVFVFGDNMNRFGFGGQAKEARGEKNTIGIPTKWYPNNREESFFTDEEFSTVLERIDEAFRLIDKSKKEGKEIVFFPHIGEGLAQLDKRAPKIYKYIKERIESYSEK